MKLGALALVGVIYGEVGTDLALAQEEAPKQTVVDQASVAQARGAVLHVEASDQRARVQALNNFNEWITVCEVPCDRPLDPSIDYRVAGKGLRPTASFRVPVQGQLSLRANMKPVRNIVLGATFTGLGGVLLLTGGLELLLGAAERDTASTEMDANLAQTERNLASVYTVVGAILAIAGAVSLIPGFIFLGSGTKSTLQTGTDTAVRAPNLRLIPGGFAF